MCPAFAERLEPANEQSEGRLTRAWYGWQLLAVDGVGAGLFATAAATGSRPVFGTGVAVYALSAPAVHAFHARPWTAAGSLTLRVLAPAFFGFLAYGSLSCGRDVADEAQRQECSDRQELRGTVGLIVGAAIATGLDASLMAFELRPVASPERGRSRVSAEFAVAPILDRGTLGISARGTF